jgi:Tfp pilus assembly protein PilO
LATDSASAKKTTGDPSLLQTVVGKYGYELPLNISVEGNYANFQIFIKKIENYQRLINITSLDISQPTQKTDLILAKIKLTAYIKK